MRRNPGIRRTAGPGGFTLLELLLVLVVMVVIAALVLPSIDRLLDGQKVDKGADLVRSALGRARVSAIREGKVHAFVCQPGSSGMLVAPLESLAGTSTNLATVFGPEREQARISNVDFADDQLPQRVRFTSTAVIANSRSDAAEDAAGAAASGALQYILFYPDGTSQDAQINITNEKGYQKRIVVRGLTGTSRVTSLEQAP